MLHYSGPIHIDQLSGSPISNRTVFLRILSKLRGNIFPQNLQASGLASEVLRTGLRSLRKLRYCSSLFEYMWNMGSTMDKYGLFNIAQSEFLEQFEVLMPKLYQTCGKTFRLESTVLFRDEVSIFNRWGFKEIISSLLHSFKSSCTGFTICDCYECLVFVHYLSVIL